MLNAEIFDILIEVNSSPNLRVTFGGDVMTDWEIRSQLLADSRWVAVAVAVAVLTLAFATRSLILTTFALLQVRPLLCVPDEPARQMKGRNPSSTPECDLGQCSTYHL